jgi:hypothetical protein
MEKNNVIIVALLLAAIGSPSSRAVSVSGSRALRAIKANLGDPEADGVVDAAITAAIESLTEDSNIDPASISSQILGISMDGTISGLTEIARTGEADYVYEEDRMDLRFQFGITNIVVSVSITMDTDTTVDGLGVAEVAEQIVDVTATQNVDGTYDITTFDVAPIDNVNVILTNLGSLSSISDELEALLSELIIETIGVAINGPILEALEATL